MEGSAAGAAPMSTTVSQVLKASACLESPTSVADLLGELEGEATVMGAPITPKRIDVAPKCIDPETDEALEFLYALADDVGMKDLRDLPADHSLDVEAVIAEIEALCAPKTPTAFLTSFPAPAEPKATLRDKVVAAKTLGKSITASSKVDDPRDIVPCPAGESEPVLGLYGIFSWPSEKWRPEILTELDPAPPEPDESSRPLIAPPPSRAPPAPNLVTVPYDPPPSRPPPAPDLATATAATAARLPSPSSQTSALAVRAIMQGWGRDEADTHGQCNNKHSTDSSALDPHPPLH